MLYTCTDSSRICKIVLDSAKHDTGHKKKKKKKKKEKEKETYNIHRIAFVCALA